MDKILYLVVFDGHRDRYGSEIYLGGIFDSEDKAKDYANKIEDLCNGVEIVSATINHEYSVRDKSDWPYNHDVCSDIYLGGYVE